VSVVAVLVSDLVVGRAFTEEGRGDQAVNSAFSLEPVVTEADVESPVFDPDGLQDLVGLSIADLPLIRDLINAIVPGDIAPLLGHT